MDRRDEETWIAIELSHYGENKVEEGEIKNLIRQDLDVDSNFPIFVPAAIFRKRGKIITLHLMEGYVFVKAGLPEIRYFKLEDKPYVDSIMSVKSGPHKMRVLSVLSNREIEDLKKQLRKMVASEIEVGSKVRILEGRYKRMEGEILGHDGENNSFVLFKLRSWERVSSIPRIFLEVV